MMGTEKLNRHFVGTALVSVLLSLLLALTPVLAVAEPANGGSASADASEATIESEVPEVAEGTSDDAEPATSQSEPPVSAAAAIAPAESELSAAIGTSAEASAQAATAGADCVMSSDTYENSVTAANMVLLVSFSDTSQGMLNAFNENYYIADNALGIKTNWQNFMWSVDGIKQTYVQRTWRDYLYEISQGQCNVKSYFPQTQADGKVVHITLDRPASDYKENDGLLVGDVASKFNAQFGSYDASRTDKNRDGFVDNLMIVPTTSGVFTSHKGSLGEVVTFGSGNNARGVKESITVVEGSLELSSGGMPNSGFSESVAVHEYLHTLGARDYYRNFNGISGNPVSYWDVMASGGVYSWPLAFTRESVGWTSIPEVNLKDLKDSYTLYAPADSDAKKGVSNPLKPQALKIKTSLSSSEYFIVEYRQRSTNSFGYDRYIGASGLIVYRVNEAHSVMGNIRGDDYVYVFRPGETGLKDSAGDVNRAAIAASTHATQKNETTGQTITLNQSIGSTDLNAKFTDNTIFFENGLNSGIKIDAVSQTDGSITFKISTADYEQADMWEALTNTDGSTPFGSWDSPTVQATSDESNPYMLVGCTSPISPLWAVWKHDGANWQQVGTRQNDMRNVRIATLNGTPYLLGVSTSNQKQLVLKALVSGVWNTVATTTLNDAIWSTDLRAAGGKLYAFAGANGDCRMFTLEGSTLKQYGPALPVASSYAVSLTDCGGQPLFVANDQSETKTNAYRFNGSSWSVTEIKDSTSSVIDSVAKDGKTYVYAFTYNGVSNDARLSVLSSDAVAESSCVISDMQDATSDTSICAGKNNLYFAKSTSTGVKAYSLPYSAANTGDVSQVTQLGGTVFSSASSMDAVAIGDTAYCMLGDTNSGSIAVRHHKLQTGDTAEPLDPSQGGSTDPTKTSISNATVSVATQTYADKALTPKPTVKVGTTTLREGTDYTLSYKNNTNAGTASVIVTGKGNYAGAVTKTFTIRPASITASAVGSVANQTYTGKALTPKPTVKVGATTLREGADYTLSYKNNTSAGTASVIVTGKGNYTGSITKTFAIAKRPISGATVGVATQTYTGKALTPKPTVKVGATTLREGADYTLSYASNVNVGTATVTITGKGNYTGTRTATFKIEKKADSSSGESTAKPSQPPAVTGSWVNSGRWWFSYDAKTRAAQRKAYPVNEWVKVGNRRYHFDGAGWMHSGWLSLSGRWYWLSSDGAMRTGWQLVGPAWYYMGPDGAMWTGKKGIGGATYYLDPSGAMRTGWSLEGSTWYFYDGSGAMATGWRSVGGAWYFLDRSSGAMRQYWLDDGGQRYFLLSSGAMVTGWARVDGTWYFFGPSGAMQKNRWVGNYYVGSDGGMATSTWVGRYHVNASGLWDATR